MTKVRAAELLLGGPKKILCPKCKGERPETGNYVGCYHCFWRGWVDNPEYVEACCVVGVLTPAQRRLMYTEVQDEQSRSRRDYPWR